MPARKARGAIVEKGEDACKVIGDYLSNHPNTTSNCGSWTSVGAGLPAMQTPRSFSNTEVMLSQASQLPHKPAPTF
ncbi:MAG: hypothetical protein CFE47_24335 [Pseudomonas sp. PGPPP1]|nr:MAG: hypothetical protein CFE47_24335 [Pseudomonas sp. PGPPP1]